MEGVFRDEVVIERASLSLTAVLLPVVEPGALQLWHHEVKHFGLLGVFYLSILLNILI